MSRLIHVTEAQAALFGRPPQPSQQPGRGRQAPRKRKEALPENQVESAILTFLRIRGWTVERQQAGTVIGVGMIMGALKRGPITGIESLYGLMSKWGNKGRADWVAVRPLAYVDRNAAGVYPGLVQRFEMEIKGPCKKPSPEQRKYLEYRVSMGFLCGWFDALEDDGFGGGTCFEVWYGKRFGDNVNAK